MSKRRAYLTVIEAKELKVPGPKGDPGESIKGDKGDPGESIKGDKGDPGRDGQDGRDGIDGKDGVGIDGKDGKDGSPDTPNEVVNKVNQADKKVLISSVNGLRAELDEIKKTVRTRSTQKGGGGMGNWVHETPSGLVNGVNTIFTTSQNIASGGKALIVLINGQMQRLGSHYSVFGRTITFTTAPETGDVVFFTYVR